MEEVWASDTERIDLVIFLNGLAIMTFELKCNVAGQSYEDAIYQYRTERNPKTRLFLFKAGALVNFAMDLEQVYMTTKLEKGATFFCLLIWVMVKASMQVQGIQYLKINIVFSICGKMYLQKIPFLKS